MTRARRLGFWHARPFRKYSFRPCAVCGHAEEFLEERAGRQPAKGSANLIIVSDGDAVDATGGDDYGFEEDSD